MLEESDHILFRPLLDRCPVRDAMDGYRGDFQMIAGRRSSWKIAFMFTVRGKARDNLIAFGNLVFDIVMAWRCLPKYLKGLFDAFASWRQSRKRRRIVVHVVRSDQLIDHVKIALIDLFIKSSHEALVFFG